MAIEPTEDEPGTTPPGETRPSSRHSVGKNLRVMVASQVVTWSLAIVLTAVVPRYLGAQAVGELGLAVSLWALAAVFIGFGTGSVITIDIARGAKSFEADVRSANGLQCIMFVICFAVVVGYCKIVGYNDTIIALVVIAGAGAIFTAFGESARSVFYGLERMTFPSSVDVVMKVIVLVFTIGILLLGGSVIALAAGGALAAVVYCALMTIGLKRNVGLAVSPTRHGVRAMVRRAAPYIVVQGVSVAYRQSDTIILSRYGGSTQVGFYAVSESLLGALIMIPSIGLTAVFPAMSRVGSERPADALRLVRRGMRMLVIFTVPIGLGVLVISDTIVRLLFGPQFARSGPVVGAMGVVLTIMVPTILVGNYATAMGRIHRWAVVTLIAIVVSIPLYIIFIPWTRHRFDNAALGTAIVFALTEFLIFFLALRVCAPDFFSRHVTTGCLKALAAGGLMVAATWSVRHRFVLIPIALGGLVYIGALLLLRTIDADERENLRRVFNRVRSRLRPT